MQNFKSRMMPLQGKNKNGLMTIWSGSSIYHHQNLSFRFGGTGFRNSEKMIMYVDIPRHLVTDDIQNFADTLPYETYLLHILSPMLKELQKEYTNIDKNVREKAQFEAQSANEHILKRSGIEFDREKNSFCLRLNFNVPLVNAVSVNAKSAVRAVRDILNNIETSLKSIDRNELNHFTTTYRKQKEIRAYMKKNDICSFVANGSILPRENGTSKPMKNAIPFLSPPSMEITIPLSGGEEIKGMAIKKGVTVITGGGYSGKSTLLDAIEMGIYDHISGDGREYVLTDRTALKIYAEDGRPVTNLNMSPFFRFLGNSDDIKHFSTRHASGSVSQAANIIESVCGGSKLLLLDEDKSATNFMIRDRNMRKIVKNEPIIPLTDRIRELNDKGVSTILVIGGSSEYLAYADKVLLMDNYRPLDVTEEIKSMETAPMTTEPEKADWCHSRHIIPEETTKPFLFFRTVETENEKKLILDNYEADITLLTALTNGAQLNTLLSVAERILSDKDAGSTELLEKVEKITNSVFTETDITSLIPETAQRFYEDIRPLDAFCCINRLRGVNLK